MTKTHVCLRDDKDTHRDNRDTWEIMWRRPKERVQRLPSLHRPKQTNPSTASLPFKMHRVIRHTAIPSHRRNDESRVRAQRGHLRSSCKGRVDRGRLRLIQNDRPANCGTATDGNRCGAEQPVTADEYYTRRPNTVTSSLDCTQSICLLLTTPLRLDNPVIKSMHRFHNLISA